MNSRQRALPARGSALALSLILSPICATACGEEPEPFNPPSYRVVGPPALVGGQCPSALDATYGPIALASGTPSKVRLTYLEPGTSNADADARLLCDLVVDYGAAPPVVAVPSESPVDIAIEFFSDAGLLMAVGMAQNIDLSGEAPVEIRATPVGEFTCPDDQLGIPRAFHSAAALPDGRVLISGGVTAAYGDPSVLDVDVNNGMYLTDAVEIYDPATGLFTQASVPGLTARAMHTSSAWTDGVDIFVALVGGFTVPDPSLPGVVPLQDGLRWAPAIAAQGTATEVLVISPDGSIARVEGPGDVPAVMSGHSPIVDDRQLHVGGQQWVTNSMTMENELLGIDLFTATDTANWIEDVPPTLLQQPRRGASVTQIGGDRALVWGGHMEADVTQMLPFAGELLTGLNGQNTPASAPITAYNGDPIIPRALHQAVEAGGDILIIGGFDITQGTARVTASNLIERLSIGSQDTEVAVAVVATADGSAPTPAGYLGIAPLSSGDVLITGGNPQVNFGACDMNQDGILCSIPDSYLYRVDSTSLEPTSTPLIRSRYGHQAVEMADGQVLVTGGLYAPAPSPTLEMVASAELLDTRSSDVDTLSPGLNRPPAEVASDADGGPRAACPIIEIVEPAQ